MKRAMRTLLSSISLLLSTHLFADCASSGIHYWPAKDTVSGTGFFILEGYYFSQDLIEGFKGKYTLYLVSDRHKVKMNLQELNKGQFHLTQAIFKPSEPLQAGKRYSYELTGLEKEHFYGWPGYGPKTYYISPVKDEQAPLWNSGAEYQTSSVQHFGCGPAVYSVFTVSITEKNESLVKVTAKNTEGEDECTYWIPVMGGKLQIGHGMCSGEFNLQPGKKYELVIHHAVDQAGNTSAPAVKSVFFTAPPAP
jgi:hypothetical protein